jgi:hypothetical protein
VYHHHDHHHDPSHTYSLIINIAPSRHQKNNNLSIIACAISMIKMKNGTNFMITVFIIVITAFYLIVMYLGLL